MLVKSSILLAGVTHTEQEYYAQSYAWLEVLCSNKPHKKVCGLKLALLHSRVGS